MKPDESTWALPPEVQPERSRLGFDLDAALNSMVLLSARVPDEAYTAQILGTERSGNGCVRSSALPRRSTCLSRSRCAPPPPS